MSSTPATTAATYDHARIAAELAAVKARLAETRLALDEIDGAVGELIAELDGCRDRLATPDDDDGGLTETQRWAMGKFPRCWNTAGDVAAERLAADFAAAAEEADAGRFSLEEQEEEEGEPS